MLPAAVATPQRADAQVALPTISGPLADAPTSHAFLAAAYQRDPLALGEQGYTETEYLIQGEARVFEWAENGALTELARGPYTTRILVRQPRAAADFNGTGIVEALNPSSPVDLPIMWAQSHRQLIADGYAWVGVTVKPNTIASLKRFDPERYAALSMPHPGSGPTCTPEAINAWSRPTMPADETGLAWDMLSQLGALLESRSDGNPLSRPAERLYMTGQSQTAGYVRTYATAFGRRVTGADGRPLYDGYLYSGSPPWQVPLHQCAPDLPRGDRRLLTGAAGVPIIEIFAQGDIGTNIETRRVDSDAAPDLFRRYEVAGAPHGDRWQERSFPSAADLARAAGAVAGAQPDCEPHAVEPSDFPIRYVLNAAWRHLDAWARNGVAPPHANPLELRPGAAAPFVPERAFVTDEHGNATGGVRTPQIDVPTARWVGAKTGAFQCMFDGYTYPFDAAKLRSLYESRDDYVAKVRASVERLVRERWLTPEDGAAAVLAADELDLLEGLP
jgi:hypothetical protein